MGGMQEWGGQELGRRLFNQYRRWGNFFVKTVSNLSLKILTEGVFPLIPVFHNPDQKDRLSPTAVALTLEYHFGPPSKAPSN